MNKLSLDEILASTFEDYRLSRSERQALKSYLEGVNFNPSKLRKKAFALVEEHKFEQGVLDWLQDICRLLESFPTPEQRRHCQSFFSPGDECLNEIRRLIRTAGSSLDICVFTITDNRIVREIEEAHAKGIRVRIITDNDKSYDLGSDIFRMAEKGIPIRTDFTVDHMHNKFMIVDGHYLLNGSYNWTRTAASSNNENIMVMDNPQAVAAFSEEFENLWKNFKKL